VQVGGILEQQVVVGGRQQGAAPLMRGQGLEHAAVGDVFLEGADGLA
jgi:hypothetical protein